MAFGSEAIQTPGQIVGGPSWLNSDRFDIVAKAEGDPGVDAQGRPTRLIAMLKVLLEERFKVKVHTEMRETQTYALVLTNKDGKLGPALHESKADCYGPANLAADSGPNLFTAIQEQLGVKLQSEKAQVEYLVIDQAERPTED
jgi:hypothetical protein